MAERGHKVTLIVADALGDTWNDGVRILDVGRHQGRMARILRSTKDVYACALKVEADIYVLHDPELIPSGMLLKRAGRKVVFDSHEDVPTQLLGKPYLGPTSAKMVSRAFQTYEHYACKRFDGVVGATSFIRDKFSKINSRTIDINNYPILGEFNNPLPWSDKAIQVCYVGNISVMRGVKELVKACGLLRTPTKLTLAGAFETSALAAEVSLDAGWCRVQATGHLDRVGVSNVMAQSMAGLVTLHPQENYLDALPVKMFEYMAAGVPVIASDFPLWRKIIESTSCGMCVDPMNPAAIAGAIDYMITHPDRARQMGTNGRAAAMETYNWHSESKKMLHFYDNL
jgi:glycosyltransferase involved in cell wall biosynthesis